MRVHSPIRNPAAVVAGILKKFRPRERTVPIPSHRRSGWISSLLAADLAYTRTMSPPAAVSEAAQTVPEAVLEMARAAVKKYYSRCFWFWKENPPLRTVDDVRSVIEHLRGYGDKNAWRAAQNIVRCL